MPGGPEDEEDASTLSGETVDPGPERRDEGRAPSSTWWQRAVRRTDKQNAENDQRADRIWEKALTQAEASAANLRVVVRFQWVLIGLLVVAVIGLAGYSVGVDLPAMGRVQIGGSSRPEAP